MSAPNPKKNGLAAIMTAFHIICRVIKRFGPKVSLALNAAEAGGLINSAENATAQAFLTSAGALCDIFQKAAGY